MELQHRFTVPAGIDEAWAHFNDIRGVAECFPGAAVSDADEESFKGTVKVKLGPIALVYNGTGTFVEKDEAARRMVIDAKGKDKRGNGTAAAKVTATMTESGPDATDVEVGTDLSITGKAAQFGRGNVIRDVSDKLLGQFVACLEQRFNAPGGIAAESAGAAASGAGAHVSPPEAPPADEAPAEPPGPVAAEVPPVEPYSSSAPPGMADTGADQSTTPPTEPPPPAEPPPRTEAPPRDDAINLGSTVLPVLVRAYWKPVAVVVVVVLIIWWLVSRD